MEIETLANWPQYFHSYLAKHPAKMNLSSLSNLS
jgi:hypothetical protein